MLEKTEAEKTSGVTPEQKAQRQAARRVGRIVLTQSHQAAHPDASSAEIKAAVAEQKPMQVRVGKQVLKAMQKAGFTVDFTETAKG